MGLKGTAALVGYAENKPEKIPLGGSKETNLEMCADLAWRALSDAGLSMRDVDGIVISYIDESEMFIPSTVSEYLGTCLDYAERVDLGGAGSAGMIWRAAAAIELGMARVVLCLAPAAYHLTPDGIPNQLAAWLRFGASSYNYGSPQAEFDIPYGHVGQNALYAMFAQRYAHCHGYDPRAMARMVVHLRQNACANPDAFFYGKPLTEDDVLKSPMIARPLHLLEIVMPLTGGAAVVVADAQVARRSPHRPVWVTGCGESLMTKSPHYADDMLETPIGPASRKAFNMAGIEPTDIHAAQIYDCYSITVLLTLEDAGFCPKGEGMRFLRDRNFTWTGDFPMNTNGGQLSFGQPGVAGGMSLVIEAGRQIMGRGEARQIRRCDNVYVSGTGGIMSEQVALILQGD
jgi:acetyl-CoA acetyltransferase